MFPLSSLNRKSASCSDLLSCVFGLKAFEESLIYMLAKRGGSSLDDLALATGRDRSTVHRSLSKLSSLGLCYRTAVGLRGGGYRHEYALMDVETMGTNIRFRVNEIKVSLDRLAESFERDMVARISSADRERM